MASVAEVVLQSFYFVNAFISIFPGTQNKCIALIIKICLRYRIIFHPSADLIMLWELSKRKVLGRPGVVAESLLDRSDRAQTFSPGLSLSNLAVSLHPDKKVLVFQQFLSELL